MTKYIYSAENISEMIYNTLINMCYKNTRIGTQTNQHAPTHTFTRTEL